MSTDIDRLRARLNEIDRELIERVAERQEIVRRIGRSKIERGIPTRDFAREREVLNRAGNIAEELGLSRAFAEKLFRDLIETSLERQEADRVAASTRSSRALLIGGAGKMGSWFARFLSSQGLAVEIADPAAGDEPFPVTEDWHAHVEDYEIIVVATPIAATRDVLAQIESLRPGALIFDLSSLKSPLRASLRRLADAGLRVTSVHPMFGPDTTLLSGRHVILVDVGNRDALKEARTLFEATMATMVEMDLEDHDRLMAYVLGLSHALNIAFFTALRESGAAASQLASMSSTTFDAQLDIASQVAAENPKLYFEIQALNDYRMAPLNALGDALARIRAVIEAGDESAFEALMEKGRAYLARRGRPGS